MTTKPEVGKSSEGLEDYAAAIIPQIALIFVPFGSVPIRNSRPHRHRASHDMTVLNELDRFHLVMDTIDRVPQTGQRSIYLKQQLRDKLIEHKRYIDKNGEHLPDIRDRKWGRAMKEQDRPDASRAAMKQRALER